jgi:hypothetical protein
MRPLSLLSLHMLLPEIGSNRSLRYRRSRTGSLSCVRENNNMYFQYNHVVNPISDVRNSRGGFAEKRSAEPRT